MASIESGTHYENTLAAPGAAKTSILTAPSGHEYQVTLIEVCASDANAGSVDLIHYQLSDTTEYIFRKAGVVPAADAYKVADLGPLVLREGDILKATPSRTGQIIRVAYIVIRKNDPSSARLFRP